MSKKDTFLGLILYGDFLVLKCKFGMERVDKNWKIGGEYEESLKTPLEIKKGGQEVKKQFCIVFEDGYLGFFYYHHYYFLIIIF